MDPVGLYITVTIFIALPLLIVWAGDDRSVR